MSSTLGETSLGSTAIVTESPDVCRVTPVQAFMSTNLNNKTKTFKDLAERILHRFGYPVVSITDVHRDQVYDAISEACERYTRYAGFTKELMAIDSRLYIPNVGIKIDDLYTISSMEAAHKHNGTEVFTRRGPDQLYEMSDDVYVCKKDIPRSAYWLDEASFNLMKNNARESEQEILCIRRDASKRFPDGIKTWDIIDGLLYKYLVELAPVPFSKDDFVKSRDKRITLAGEEVNDIYREDDKLGKIRDSISRRSTYDYDLMDYRKVIDVVDYVEGSSTSMTSLFSFEAALATQTYFTYQFSLRGFDMVSWYSMHEWRKTREKMLATQRDWSFDESTQYLRFSPQPKEGVIFGGVIECYVEKALKDIITSPWVQDYARAIVKEEIGMARGKWGDGVQLLGGGALTGNALAQQGVQEQKELLEKLEKNNGYGEAAPCRFFVG